MAKMRGFKMKEVIMSAEQLHWPLVDSGSTKAFCVKYVLSKHIKNNHEGASVMANTDFWYMAI